MINVKTLSCACCGIGIKAEKFLKDKSEQPVYYHMINKEEAVTFCSAEHSSKWAGENKEKIWDRK